MMICVTGTPGVGKTAVSRALSEMTGMRHMELNNMVSGMAEGFDSKRGSLIIDEEKLRKIKVNGIADGHLSHFCDCDAIIVVRCSEQKEHIRRMRSKGWGSEKIRENMEAEIMEVIAEEARERAREMSIPLIEVDSSGKSPHEVAEEILNNLSFLRKE